MKQQQQQQQQQLYETVIGLEVHVQLKTKSKMFCGCPTRFGARPNTQVCPVCLGLPGVLPVINKQAFDYAFKAALALNCRIADFTKFDRKNYFYPDLPKNYQISQYDIPFAKEGWLEIDFRPAVSRWKRDPSSGGQQTSRKKRIGITRVHLEEDAGKLIHPEIRNEKLEVRNPTSSIQLPASDHSFVDLNRTGVPLLEIVSQPEINSPEEAHTYLTALKEIMQYLDISDCDMEKGSLRCDANLSLRLNGAKELGVKTEIKNINSFKFVKQALEYEARRQAEILKQSGRIAHETRCWDEHLEETRPMRSKEEVHDYRYFPEPDLEPIRIDAAWLNEIKKNLPELPQARRERFIKEYQLPEYDSGVLTQEKALADYFEECVKSYPAGIKATSKWIINNVLNYLNEHKIDITEFKTKPKDVTAIVKAFEEGKITSTASKQIWAITTSTNQPAEEVMKNLKLDIIDNIDVLESSVKQVIEANPKMAADYRGGKEAALMALVGQVMRTSKGKANPQKVKEILISFLK